MNSLQTIHDDDYTKNGHVVKAIASYFSAITSPQKTMISSKKVVIVATVFFIIIANSFRVIFLNRTLPIASLMELPMLQMNIDQNQTFGNVTHATTTIYPMLNTTTPSTSSSWTFDKIDSYWNESLHSKQKNLPHLVIHVGPPKTASTTLQEYLTQWSYKGILQKYDQYVYIGRFVRKKPPTIPADLLYLQLALYNLDCHAMMSTIRQQYDEERNKPVELQQNFINITLSEAILSNLSCARNIIEYIKPYVQNLTNLLYAEEGLSVRDMKNYGRGKVFYRQYYGTNSYLTIFDWVSLHAILQDYYQITVMMTYRRYYDWLPSVKQQIERWMGKKPDTNRWPKYNNPINATHILMNNIMIANQTTTDYLKSNIIQNSATKFKGRDIVPIFPNWWKTNLPPGTTADLHAYYLDLIIHGIDQVNHQHGSTTVDSSRALRLSSSSPSSSPLIHIAIVNMHALLPPLSNEDYNTATESSLSTSSSTVRSLFFCALPGATNLCRYSQELDQKEARSVNNSELHSNAKKSTWYDELVINAARYGFINITKYATLRHDIVLLTEKYHKSKIKTVTKRSLTQSNSKLSSSVKKTKTKSKQNSLNVGGSLYKLRYDNKSGIDIVKYEFPLLCPSVVELTEFLNQSLFYEEQILPDFYYDKTHGKNDHVRRFWDAVHNKNKESYCSIDIIAILQQPHWQDFFMNMLPLRLKRLKKKTTL